MASASFSRDDVRAFDRWADAEAGLPTRVLMENAGRGAAEVLVRLGVDGPVRVVCGKGNNGGDGLVLARALHVWGHAVRVLLVADPATLSPDAAANWKTASAAGVPAEAVWPFDDERLQSVLAGAAWTVDALLGIGQTSPARPPLDRAIAILNESPPPIFAIDVPSGLDADTGEPLGPTIRARHTATFVAPKKGFGNPTSRVWTGEVHVVDLGITRPHG